MVEAAFELALEIVWGMFEMAAEYWADGGREDDGGDHHAFSRYANSICEERPLPLLDPWDLN